MLAFAMMAPPWWLLVEEIHGAVRCVDARMMRIISGSNVDDELLHLIIGSSRVKLRGTGHRWIMIIGCSAAAAAGRLTG